MRQTTEERLAQRPFQNRWRIVPGQRRKNTTTLDCDESSDARSGSGSGSGSCISCISHSNSNSSSDEESTSPPNHPQTILGEGRADPFGSIAGRVIPVYAQEAMDHALSFTWPQVLPSQRDKAVTRRFQSEWMKLVMGSPVVLHTFIFATTTQMICLRDQKEDDVPRLALRAQLFHQNEALACVGREISSMRGGGSRSSPTPTPSDALILSIVILAVNGVRPPGLPPRSHPLSPLAKTQSMHLFSVYSVVEAHVRALNQLVALKGGLEAVEAFGLRDTILLADNFFSTRLGTRPAHRWPDPLRSMTDSDQHILDVPAQRFFSHLGSSFKPFTLADELRRVLHLMRVLTVALDHHVRGGPHAPDLVDLVLARNALQNKLLWLTPVDDDDEEDGLDSINNSIRIAAYIFSDMVLFPLLADTSIKPRLAAELRRCLNDSTLLQIEEDNDDEDEAMVGLLQWLLTLGGIAASFTRHRGWYVEQLVRQFGSVLLEEDGFDVMAVKMASYMWWNDVCDPPARLLWTEAKEVYEGKNSPTWSVTTAQSFNTCVVAKKARVG